MNQAITLALITGLIGILVGDIGTLEPEFKKPLFTASVGLIFGTLFGGLVKLLFDEHQDQKDQRANKVQFLTNTLADLKEVYDRVERARILIPAHRSALTYGNEIRDLIDARVQLRNVIRALQRGVNDIDPCNFSALQLGVGAMEKYLETLTSGFEKKYKEASLKQEAYKLAVERGGKDKEYPQTDIEKLSKEIWEFILAIPGMIDFIGEKLDKDEIPEKPEIMQKIENRDFNYDLQFEKSLDMCSWILREEIQVALGRERREIDQTYKKTFYDLSKGKGRCKNE